MNILDFERCYIFKEGQNNTLTTLFYNLKKPKISPVYSLFMQQFLIFTISKLSTNNLYKFLYSKLEPKVKIDCFFWYNNDFYFLRALNFKVWNQAYYFVLCLCSLIDYLLGFSEKIQFLLIKCIYFINIPS